MIARKFDWTNRRGIIVRKGNDYLNSLLRHSPLRFFKIVTGMTTMLVYAVKEVKIAELPFSKRLLFSRSLSANVIIA